MKRKLVKQGAQALTLTLPSVWVQQQHLKPGDEVEVILAEGALTVTSEHSQPAKEITVNVSGLPPRLADRFMARAYQKGYDKITVHFDDPALMLAIKNKIPELMGFEILNIAKDKMEIQVIASELNLDFDTLLRRGFLILLDMSITCHDAWKGEDTNALENIWQQDFDVNRFLYFCLRTLNKSQTIMTFGKSILYYQIESLEDLGDEFKALGQIFAKCKPDTDLLRVMKKLNELFRLSYEFFYKPEREKAVQAFALYQEITILTEQCFGKKNAPLTKALVSLEFCNRIIYHLTTMRLDTLKELRG